MDVLRVRAFPITLNLTPPRHECPMARTGNQ